MGRPGKDWTNVKCGMMTFIKQTGKLIYKDSLEWEAICDCGKTCYVRPSDFAGGKSISCGCHRPFSSKENGFKTRKFEPHISSARAVWRGIYKDCDFETFYLFSQKACHYCNRLPHRIFNIASTLNGPNARFNASEFQIKSGDFTYNGLDRVDSSKGHTVDNIVSCCRTCNIMKGNMGYDQFIAHIKIMNEHLTSDEFIPFQSCQEVSSTNQCEPFSCTPEYLMSSRRAKKIVQTDT